MDFLFNTDIWIGFITLVTLEIVLGIDNIIVLAILTNKLPEHQQEKGRRLGLSLALFSRLALLASIFWVMSLTRPLFVIWNYELSGRDLILFGGGLFLIFKSVTEIHGNLEEAGRDDKEFKKKIGFASTIVQIILIDIIFSLDSVITAVGMVNHLGVMMAAVVAAVGVMLFLSGPIARFIKKHPSIKILALSFLIMIGTALVAEALDFHFPKAYIYFAMAFSVAVEFINIRIGTRSKR
jgi:predicted tellurium resistance membrane protein TerC